jgi:hypothetical protein
MSPHVNESRFDNDLDRVMSEWFADGPRRAPEAPMTAAIAFARDHPRRRDPLPFLRPDPMGGRSAFAPLMQPVWVAAVVGMLLVAVVAVSVGSPQPQEPQPVPSAPPSPTASPTPSPSPTPTPAPTPFDVELEITAGQPATVTILDRSGTLGEARSGTPEEGASVADGEVQVTQVDPTTLQLRWTGLPCLSQYDVTIDLGLAITLDITPCAGATDTFPMDRVLLLEFTSPVDAGDVQTTVTGSVLPPG